MKKFNILVIVFLIIATFSKVSIAERMTQIHINGHQSYIDEDGLLYKSKTGRFMVPLRIVAENMGYEVIWDNNKKEVTIDNNEGTVVVLTIDQPNALINDSKVPIDIQDGKVVNSTAELKKGVSYVPVRFIGEAFGARVEYRILGAGVDIITILTNAESKLSGPFIEPKFKTFMYDPINNGDGHYFLIQLENIGEYEGKYVEIQAFSSSHIQYEKYISPDIFGNQNNWSLIDRTKYKKIYYGTKEYSYEIYTFGFGHPSTYRNPETKLPFVAPKDGEIITIQINMTMAGETRTYYVQAPFIAKQGGLYN